MKMRLAFSGIFAFAPVVVLAAPVSEPATRSATYAGAVASMVFALVAVVGIILGLAWLLRRTGIPGQAMKSMRVSSAVSLGTREKVVVVTVDGRRFLIGVTAQQVNLITELGAEEPDVEAPTGGGDFSKKLQEILARGISK